jgi:hypothetical protein
MLVLDYILLFLAFCYFCFSSATVMMSPLNRHWVNFAVAAPVLICLENIVGVVIDSGFSGVVSDSPSFTAYDPDAFDNVTFTVTTDRSFDGPISASIAVVPVQINERMFSSRWNVLVPQPPGVTFVHVHLQDAAQAQSEICTAIIQVSRATSICSLVFFASAAQYE